MSEILLPENTDLLDDEASALLELRKTSGQRVEEWERVSLIGKDNETCLAEEMESTLNDVASFVEDIEAKHKGRVFRRSHEGFHNWEKFHSREREFNENVELGMNIMKKITAAVGIEAGDIVSGKREPPKINITDSMTHAGDRIRKSSHNLMSLMTRFARVLEAEGIPHRLPVPPPPPEAPGGRAKAAPSQNRRVYFRPKPHTRASIQTSVGSSSITDYDIATPVAFLHEYATRENLILHFTEIKVVKTLWYTEYIYNCKMNSISANGRGKKKILAKQHAANQVLKIFINKQRKGTLPPEMKPLQEVELDLALSIICENEDFEAQLEAICSEQNIRQPIYTPVINTEGTAVRCKAFGLNTIGRGKTKEIARRMAAKIVLDTIRRRKDSTKHYN